MRAHAATRVCDFRIPKVYKILFSLSDRHFGDADRVGRSTKIKTRELGGELFAIEFLNHRTVCYVSFSAADAKDTINKINSPGRFLWFGCM